MESAITSFRRVLRQSWSRRVILILTTTAPTPPLDHISVDYIASLRDPEWEERERSYHETALGEVNSLVRKYNAMAPYVARRALYMRNVELERLYKESAGEIHEKLVTKLGGEGDGTALGPGHDEDDDFSSTHGTSLPSLGIWAMVKKLFTRVRTSAARGESD
jgi:DnaJ family protein C protein 28